ncbi:MAG TPA: bifunctional 3,4-dihydroxy-2-butanone-4-phosphate synthase/GTP cyclohydrolase II, partial [Nannocystis exedens]|nr:bifunctional 3,4-dihydroxy-2-butanone-4-phosphate synthase/GTP cyclohydrolase II [Nannocystis exedens]
ANVLGDVFGLAGDDSSARMRAAVRQINAAGRGVFLYVAGEKLSSIELPGPKDRRQSRPLPKAAEAGFREVGLGAQVLRSLGIRRIRVMTNNPRKIIGLEGYGIETLGSVTFGVDGK